MSSERSIHFHFFSLEDSEFAAERDESRLQAKHSDGAADSACAETALGHSPHERNQQEVGQKWTGKG